MDLTKEERDQVYYKNLERITGQDVREVDGGPPCAARVCASAALLATPALAQPADIVLRGGN